MLIENWTSAIDKTGELLTGASVMTNFSKKKFCFVYLMHQINKWLGLQIGKGLIVYCDAEFIYVFSIKSLVCPPNGERKKLKY